jgi:hypothetical protein
MNNLHLNYLRAWCYSIMIWVFIKNVGCPFWLNDLISITIFLTSLNVIILSGQITSLLSIEVWFEHILGFTEYARYLYWNLMMVIDLTKTAYYSICNWLWSLLLLVCSSVMRCGMYDIPWSIFKWLRNATPLFTVSFTISPLLQILHFIMCSSLSAIW